MALRVGRDTVADVRRLERAHNEHVLGMLDELFGAASVQVADLDVVGFGCGPGSFTGVRIAAAVVQAIAVAANARVVPVPTSCVWVASALAATPMPPTEWLCGVRSRGEAYYLSRYRVHDGEIHAVNEDVLCEAWPQRFPVPPGDVGFAGDVPPWLPQAVRDVAVECVPSAEAFLDRVSRAHERGDSLAAERALPSYVRGDSPWRATASRG